MIFEIGLFGDFEHDVPVAAFADGIARQAVLGRQLVDNAAVGGVHRL